MDMTGGISFKKSHLRAVAAVAVVLGAGLIAAAPARADHDGGPDIGFHFFFGFPVPFFVPPPPPPPPAVYYYQPPPQIVYRDRPYYREYQYRDHYWRQRGHDQRGHDNGRWHDGRGYDDDEHRHRDDRD